MGKIGKREMIILGVMGVAILYAALDFLVLKKKAAPVQDMTQKTADLNAFVTDLTAGLSKDVTKNLQTIIFSRAEKEWKQDPFLDAKSYRIWSKVQESEKGGAAAPKIEFAYTGYLEVNRERIAIINGSEYKAGDELDVKGFVLKSVSPAGVAIENKTTRAVHKVPLQE